MYMKINRYLDFDMENKQIVADIKDTLVNCPFLEEMAGKTIFITGATGMIGTMIIKVLQTYNHHNNAAIHIVANIRNQEKAQHKLVEYIDKNIEWVVGDICTPIVYDKPIDYIIHCASTTTSQDFVCKPVETIKTALTGTLNVLSFAHQKSVKKMIYTSSLEVYGVPDTFEVTEESNGRIDWTNVRSSYSEGKRMAECICRSYFSEYGVPIVIARLAQTFGAGFEPTDNRVYAQFVRAAVSGQDIVLRTKGATVRNYCYLTDAVTALLLLCIKGVPGEAYNVANEYTTCSIAEMAKIVENLSNGKTKVVFDLSTDTTQLGYNPEMKIKLLSNKLQELGWKPQNDIQMAFKKAINGLK